MPVVKHEGDGPLQKLSQTVSTFCDDVALELGDSATQMTSQDDATDVLTWQMLAMVSLFRGTMVKADLELLVQGAQILHKPKEHRFVHEGQMDQSMYMILSGEVSADSEATCVIPSLRYPHCARKSRP